MAMIRIDPGTWPQLSALLDEALDLPTSARAAWLETLSVERRHLLPALLELLAQEARVESNEFLHAPRLERSESAGDAGTESPLRAHERVGPYRLTRELGRGGMGVVWLAERADGLFQRPVALKLPHATASRADLGERMTREREILATLDHPHIARLYDAGITASGQPYLALEYVPGCDIVSYCAGTGNGRIADVQERLRLFLQVADAVSYAHRHLVLHRDLKPANIQVTADGQVRLLDFGIAKLLGQGEAGVTRLTELSGRALTPDYASPEQILGEPLSVASDIYSLGVVLYELLSGQRPYRLKRQSRGALEDAILQAEPVRPSDAAPPDSRAALRGDLDTIVLKALKKLPTERYRSVAELAEDVTRHLHDLPVLARPDHLGYRIGKFVRRNRAVVAGTAAVLLAITSAAVFAIRQARVAVVERERADQVRSFLTSLFEKANPYAAEGKAVTAAELLDQARKRIATLSADQAPLRVELLNVTGASLLGLGDYDQAESVAAQAITESQALEPDDVLRLRSRVLRTDIDAERGRATELARELEQLLPRLEADPRRYAEELLRAYQNRVRLQILRDQPREAESSALMAFDFARTHFGTQDPRTVAASNLRAEAAQYDNPDPEAAVRVARQALDFAIAAHATNQVHPRVAEARTIYATALSQAHREQPAIEQWYQAMEDARASLGADSYLQGQIAVSMLPSLRRSGRIKEAMQVADAGMRIIDRHVQHVSRFRAMHGMTRGTIALAARRGDLALVDLDDSTAVLTTLLGAENGDALTARCNRALAVTYLGRLDEAKSELDWLQPRYARVMPEYMNYLHYVSGVRWRLAGRPVDAITAQKQALTTSPEGDFGSFSRMRAFTELALAQAEAGQPKDALDTLRELEPLLAKQLVATSPYHAEAWLAEGRARLSQGDIAKALEPLRRAGEFWEKFDPTNREAAETAYWTARALRASGDPTGAGELLRRARPILTTSPLARDRALQRG